ncbi:IS3 family transposase [Morganella morganii]|uniref:IS3 family transposase n=1 Tax=Morganella morganii TaxID=582 RepID=UPI001FFC9CD4|nr:IS3 family transposase [Morganella morganii]
MSRVESGPQRLVRLASPSFTDEYAAAISSALRYRCQRRVSSGKTTLWRTTPDRGTACSRVTFNVKTVAASLRRQGLRAKASRKFSPVSYKKHGLPVSENLLQQDFSASGPNQKWVGDITYLRTDEGWLYLAVVIDLWSRAVIGWSMSSRMTAQLACDALQMALWRRKRPKKVIVHTDRGGQYCSADYQALLTRHSLRGSMSAKGNCYDNACAESFFHSLKVECVHGERFISRETMRTTVFNYIECDYNRWRRHSACGGLSPEQFENQNLA